jgi:hypothetical protein
VTQPTLRDLLGPGLTGLKHNVLPGLVLQTVALLVVVAYAFVPAAHGILTEIGDIKLRYGYAYSALSTAFFGGVVPFAVLAFTGKVSPSQLLPNLLFYVGFWLWKGVEVDAFYRLQGVVFGNVANVTTIAAKAAVDQFVYNAFWAAPTQLVFFLWKDAEFSISTVRGWLRQESLGRRVLVILLSSWTVWIPATVIIYSLPSALQIPLFNLVLCFWSLLLSFVVRKTN